jgi:hypothetical protein
MLQVLLKYLLSFLKTDWDIDDYPIRVRRFDVEDVEPTARLKPVAWSAQVVNWVTMQGHGDTAEAALADLRRRFVERKQNGLTFPRPGRGLPIEFAPAHRIAEHPGPGAGFLLQGS